MPRGRPKKPQGTHPVVQMVSARITKLGIPRAQVACELLGLMDSPKPCNRSAKSNFYRWLYGNVTPGPRARDAMLKWLEKNP